MPLFIMNSACVTHRPSIANSVGQALGEHHFARVSSDAAAQVWID